MFQLDVKSTFLNGELEEEVYMEQLKGYVIKDDDHKVYHMRKTLRGLKQASRDLEQ